ncbi:hypothetical protein MUK42_14380 [Musa troglodytarum]|uniref:Uncharacterized protein n=1 Tax=Musa troglodytarum TaxID=320322 RepID=A0A9E7I3L5_9LILI|nr:hypothetical protein MUK42_14380 [Musa troglodytarum]
MHQRAYPCKSWRSSLAMILKQEKRTSFAQLTVLCAWRTLRGQATRYAGPPRMAREEGRSPRVVEPGLTWGRMIYNVDQLHQLDKNLPTERLSDISSLRVVSLSYALVLYNPKMDSLE